MDGGENTVRVRGRTIDRGESPMTRQRKKLMEEKKKLSGNYFFNDDLLDVNIVNAAIDSETNNKFTKINSIQDKPNQIYATSENTFHHIPKFPVTGYIQTNAIKDNMRHQYGFDREKSNSDHALKCKKYSINDIKKEPGVQKEVIPFYTWILSPLTSLLSIYRSTKPNMESPFQRIQSVSLSLSGFSVGSTILTTITLLITLFAGIMWMYCDPNVDNHANIDGVLSEVMKQKFSIQSMEGQIKMQHQSIQFLESKMTSISKNIYLVNDSMLSLKEQLEKSNALNKKNYDILRDELGKTRTDYNTFVLKVNEFLTISERKDNMLSAQFKKLKTVNDELGSEVSSVVLDIQSMKKNTSTVVRNEVKKEIQKERQNIYGENTLCVGEECKFRGSNMIAHIQAALEMHRADTIGFPDFALKSGGGSIYGNHYSETCDFGSPTIKLFGLPLYIDPSSPRLAISAEHNPGDCWHMKGSEGYIVIKLATEIQPTMVSLEHLDKNLDRFSKYMYLMAPKDCEVYAWFDLSGNKKILLGTFTYQREGSTIQTYSLKKRTPHPVLYVELRVLSNWGNSDCTCIYRFRVHGVSYNWVNED